MSAPRTIAGLTVLALVAAIAMAGCGGSSSDANETEASKTFLKKGSKNKIATFGEEADSDEREAASEVLVENFEARETGEWAEQCSSLTAGRLKKIEENSLLGKGASCAENIKAFAEPLPESKEARENTLEGPIDALRIKGDRAYALYHGKGSKDYAMPMRLEDGEWKVGSLTTTEIK
jgi:hypothetical protein